MKDRYIDTRSLIIVPRWDDALGLLVYPANVLLILLTLLSLLWIINFIFIFGNNMSIDDKIKAYKRSQDDLADQVAPVKDIQSISPVHKPGSPAVAMINAMRTYIIDHSPNVSTLFNSNNRNNSTFDGFKEGKILSVLASLVLDSPKKLFTLILDTYICMLAEIGSFGNQKNLGEWVPYLARVMTLKCLP